MQNGKNKIVVLGGGESGTGSAVLALKMGYEVFLSDNGKIRKSYKDILSGRGIKWEEAGHTMKVILAAGEVIKSPGIPDEAGVVKAIREKGIPIISEIEFASRFTKAKMICITGSNGKTTTTNLIWHMMSKAGMNVGMAGNVGNSFAMQVAENDFEYYVLELSSFQLDDMYEFKSDISILLNITPDHLDRYNYDMKNYVNSKFKIIQNQYEDDYFIYCSDDKLISSELESRDTRMAKLPFSLHNDPENTAYVNNDKINIQFKNKKFDMSIQDLALKGKHNTYNSMAAGIAGQVLRIRKEIIRESLSDFQGVEHRLEPVIKVHGIMFMNDSKATNVNSTWYALESMTKNVILIIGGIDKGNDYSSLIDLVRDKVKGIICLGKDNEKIIKSFENAVETIVEVDSMENAVRKAYYLGEKGDTVLLSPACASFDLFENYEDRGRQFKQAVRNL
ncbi:MAG: UDP-N-acetylmuramoyl-L-alanine--D-glutamate ligase [Bacteroidales bacterium]|nr:UDP-N-acetylmuramoyl-L-alanine--D-glutamate ligase [Bacteroidales bacterium]